MDKGIDYTGVSVVYYCHDGKGNVLMAKRSQNSRDEQGVWDIGGGALEFGQTVEDCLRKEIQEEYCAQVVSHEFLGFRDTHRVHSGKETHWIALDFKVLINPEGVKIGEPHKFDGIGWFKMWELPRPNHSQFPEFLSRYGDKLK